MIYTVPPIPFVALLLSQLDEVYLPRKQAEDLKEYVIEYTGGKFEIDLKGDYREFNYIDCGIYWDGLHFVKEEGKRLARGRQIRSIPKGIREEIMESLEGYII